MNVWTELAEKVHNPNFQTGADIQRQLDIFSKLQGPNIQSNIGYAVPGMGDQGGGVEAPSQSAWGGDDPNFGSIVLGSFLGPNAARFAGGQQGLAAYNEAFPSPITPFGKMLSYAPKFGAKMTGLPDIVGNLVGRQIWNPFLYAMEGLFGYGNNNLGPGIGSPTSSFGPTSGYAVPGGWDPSVYGETQADYAVPDQGYNPVPDMSITDAMAMLGMGMEGVGSEGMGFGGMGFGGGGGYGGPGEGVGDY